MRSPALILVGVLATLLFADLCFGAPAQRRGKREIQWEALVPTELESEGGATFDVQADKSVLVGGVNPPKDTYTITYLTDLEGIKGFQLEALPHPSLGGNGPGRSGGGNFVLTGMSINAATKMGSRSRTIGLRNASASFSQNQWTVTGAIDGLDNTGWAIYPMNGNRSLAVFEAESEIRYSGGARITLTLDFQALNQHSIGRFRLSSTRDAHPLRAEQSEESWRGMPAKIDHGIALGVEYLLSNQELDGSWATRPKEYRNGMTALAVYTLLKAKVHARHPAIVRGVEFLRSESPQKTYSIACQILALTALGDPEDDEWIEELADELMDWQRDGGFSYPAGGIDLSNTQYGALALRAAAINGVKIPSKVWQRLGERTMLHQEEVDRPDDPAPFGYTIESAPSGGMTVAGVAILAICAEQLESRADPKMLAAQVRGMEWLFRHFSPTKEPMNRGGDTWYPYYLYGVERVGALTGLDFLGGLDWYREGARYVVGIQKPSGAWATAATGDTLANTCFCILFLSKATAASSGPNRAAKVDAYGGDDPERDVSLRATGDTPLTIWVSSFGKELLHKYAWDNEESAGLRVKKVDYVTPGRIVFADGRTDTSPWMYSMRDPTGDWFAEKFPDSTWKEGAGAFGSPDNRNAVVRTVWESERIYMRRWFDVDVRNLVDPVLFLSYSNADDSGAPLAPLVCLFDEDEGFPLLVKGKTGQSEVEHSIGDASNGASCLRVTPQQVHELTIPDWSFRITEKPEPGEFRYLRYAWRKDSGGGIMLQFANQGKWGDSALRYFAGSNDVKYNPAIQVDKSLPKRWTVVTRDLYADFGGEAMITGLSLTPMNGGPGYFDEMYIARKRSDFGGIPKDGMKAIWREGASSAVEAAVTDGAVQIHLNGKLLYKGGMPTRGFNAVKTEQPILDLLRKGRNLLTVACSGDGSTAVDVGIRDLEVIASVPGDPGQPSGAERFPIQHSFDRPGTYDLTARVHFVPPENAETGESMTIVSEPLSVDVNEAVDAAILEYARDPQRNLLVNARKEIQVSSEFPEWPKAQAADNMQALAWLCADGDKEPWISIEVDRPIRANTILLSHARPSKIDPERTTRAQRVEVRINGGGTPHVLEMTPDDMRKAELRLKKPLRVRKIELRVIAATPGHAVKTAVGFAEVELQMRK